MDEPSLWARILGRAAYEFTQVQPMLPTYAHLVASALLPIYAGAHASLTRPTSAARPARKRHRSLGQGVDDSSDEEDESEDEEHKMEGLAPTDAIMMPLFAGITLAGLYFLIRWLEDPALLNKLLNGYFALFGVFSVSRLVTDALDIGHSLIYPHRFALRGILYHVNGKEKKAIPIAGGAKNVESITSPLPGVLARLPLPDRLRAFLWADRAMPGNKWTIRLYLHRLFAGKVLIGPHGFVGAIAALLAVAYFNLVDKPWYLTNLMGFGFSYGALQLMSPTTFATGSLILGALFFYDIYFVFYTPMMVTVAKSLDVPIKLVFPRPSPADDATAKPSHAMLGLGDVVLPGIMIGLALRFDLYLFYFRCQKRRPASNELGEVVEKAQYYSLAGRWSDYFWTHSLTGRQLFASSKSVPDRPFTFPKTYFNASLMGYVVGMITTLAVMHIWGHAQPALLYLVPGVLGSLWLTALVRGELGAMWEFSEAIDEDHQDCENGNAEVKPASERSSFFSLSDKKAQDREQRMKRALEKHVRLGNESESDIDNDMNRNVKALAGHRPDREVFSFSIEAPWRLKLPRSVRRRGSLQQEMEDNPPTTSNATSSPSPSVARKRSTAEPPGKRARLG